MKRIPSTKVLSVFSILILLFFTSCNNVFENTISQQQTADSQEAADDNVVAAQITNSPLTIQINGNLNVEGALPSEFAKAAGRSAKPSIPDDSSYEYYVKATSADSEKLVREAKIPASVPASEVTGSVQYTLQLEVRRTWTFKAGFRKVNTTDDILIDINTDSGSPITKSLSDDTTSQAVSFKLKPLQKGGKGRLDLKMKKVPDGITKLRLFNNGSEGTNEDWLPSSILEVNVDKDTDDNNYIRSVNGEYNIDSGTYNITMVFYMTYGTAPNQYDIPMYITYQTINVFDNLTTNVWVSNSTSDSNQIITSTDGFKLTSDLIQNFAENTIYVGCPEGLNVSTSDDYVGSAYAPLRTLTRAINTIQAKGNGSAYRIFVSGEQSGNFLIPSGINTGKAASIEIKTTTGNAGRAVLNGAGTGSVLTVESAVPLTLSNIQLKNGKGDVEKGGGIMMIAGTTVTLESGTVIGDDSSSISNPADSAVNSSNCAKLGGGIYTLGNLTLKSGSKVCYNYSNGTETEQGGGGIFCIGGSVTLENGAIVSKNGSAGNGGAIYLKDGTLKMSGAASVQGESTNNEAGKNDVWLAAGKYITLTDSAEFSDLVEIRADWKRGKAVVKADNDTIVIKDQRIANKFSLFIPEGNGWQTRYYTDRISVNSPIYISDTGNNDNDGSENSPFPTIARAIDDMTEADADYEIFIDGTVTGIHSFPSTLKKEVSAGDANGTHYAQSILIKGKNGLYTSGEHQGEPQDVMDGNSEGSVITIESPVPITIEDLKITKGGNTNEGGGINMKAGTDVTINDGVLITDNTATTSGGGIFDRGGHLKINGGKISKNHLTGTSGNDLGGVGVFIGGNKDITKTIFEMTGGEISENDAGTALNRNGSGVKLRNGDNGVGGPVEFHMSGGKITKNKSPFRGANIFTDVAKIIISDDAEVSYGEIISSSGQAHGAGILLWGGAHLEMNGGKIFGNKATVSNSTKEACAGVLIPSDCHFTMTGGEIYDNNATCSVNGGGILGGAVYVQGEFNLSGTAKIKYGVEDPDTHAVSKGKGKNDICIFQNYNHPINLSDNLSSHTENDPIGINLNDWKRGVSILSATDNFTISDDLQKKFKLTAPDEDDWQKYISSNNKSVTINAPIYVGTNTVIGSDTNAGTQSSPFASIGRACQEMNDANTEYIINVNGTVATPQTIPDTISNDSTDGKVYHAKSILIQGKTSNQADKINGEGSGTALTVNTSVPITIKDLTITGGTASGSGDAANGGGIYIAEGTVKLTDGAKITGNKASGFGGGVYLAGANSKLFMNGSSLIGDLIESTATSSALPSATDTTAGCANTAASGGGGIYNNGGAIYIGYSAASSKSDMAEGYGVRRNFAESTYGGGICNRIGTLVIASGSVSYNQCVAGSGAGAGGGIFSAYEEGKTTSVTIESPKQSSNKLVMYGNKAVFGGAISLNTNAVVTIKAGQIGGDGTNQQNIATDKGGAVYHAGKTLSVSGSAVIYPGSEQTNDVFLPANTTITVGSLDTSGTVASITPAVFSRGTNILSSSSTLSDTVKAQFILTKDNDGWERKDDTSAATKYVYITSPIYVVDANDPDTTSGKTRPDGFNKGKTVANGANGTKTSPYASIADALGCADISAEKKITIVGTVKGTQSIASTSIPNGLGSLELTGYKASGATSSSATLNGNQAGSTITVNTGTTTFPVTITDLTITGGNVTGANGGGINITKGTVLLGDGAKITGNTATASNSTGGYGGGVYVSSNGKLLMYGKSLIGDSATSTTLASSAGTSYYANKAACGAGIYNDGGAVYIGYDSTSHKNSMYSDSSNWYGVRRNLCTTSGAGIYHSSGTLLIASGDISYNFANTQGTTSGGAVYFNANATISGGTFTGNKAANGGAFYIKADKELTIDGSAIITKNVAVLTGGAVCNDGTLTMSAGSIGAASALNSVTSNVGGAIYQNGTFNISGSAVVYAGTGVGEKQNDVYLTSTTKYITVNDSLSGSDKVAAVTPSTWKRGNQVIAADGTKVTSINATIAGRFAVSDGEWSVTNHSNVGKLDAQLWVSGTGYDSTNGVGAGDDSKRGTKSKPYKTIKKAAEQCWTTDKAFTINISGMINGATQEIPAATTTTTLASKITLSGYTGNTTHGIDRGLASESAVSGGSALIINYCGYVDITNLLIMGGNTTGNGGGIQINGPTTFSATTCPRVNLRAGTLVQQNKAKLGGGVYSYHSILCLSGDAAIGNDGVSDRSASNTALSAGINIATNAGGGIYSTGGRLYLGAAWINGSYYNSDAYKLTKGVYANVCTATSGYDSCGGIYSDGYFYFYSGNINLNYGINTGGIYSTGSSAQCYMSGGTIHKNNGTGFYNNTGASLWMSGDAVIGDDGTASLAASNNCSNSKGGLVNVGTARLGYSTGTTKAKLSGGIYRNYLGLNAQDDGGAGIKNTGTLYFDSGTIAYNYLYNGQSSGTGGGGIFSSSTVYMTGASSQYACITNNKSSEAGGGLCLNGTSAKLLMSGYALIGKTGQTAPPSASTTDGVNTASKGGGIAAYNGATICLGYSSFTSADSNTTSSLDNGGVYFNYATTNGGGIYCQGSSGKTINVYIASGKINANKAYYSSGGTTYGHGGGIWANTYCDIYMGGGQISKNSAMNYGGGVYATGRIFMYGTALIGDTGSSVATSSSYGNTAATGGGVYVKGANACLYMGSKGEVSGGISGDTLDSSYGIRHNYASGASSEITASNPTGFGGGVYFEGECFYVTSGTIGYNLANKGGGVAANGNTYENNAGYYSGLYENSSVKGNRAKDGAGLYLYKLKNGSNELRIYGSIESNDAATDGGNGGGIYNYWSALEISGSSAKINSNKAANGGGIYIPVDGSETSGNTSWTYVKDGAHIDGNEATYCGGGIYNYDATLYLYTSSISYNKATNATSGQGGAMYIYYYSYTHIESGTITMTPTLGYVGLSRYNDVFTPNHQVFFVQCDSGAVTVDGKIYITITNAASVGDTIVGVSGSAGVTLPANKYELTSGSAYYSNYKIGSNGKLVVK